MKTAVLEARKNKGITPWRVVLPIGLLLILTAGPAKGFFIARGEPQCHSRKLVRLEFTALARAAASHPTSVLGSSFFPSEPAEHRDDRSVPHFPPSPAAEATGGSGSSPLPATPAARGGAA
jgi:hypothetical protein